MGRAYITTSMNANPSADWAAWMMPRGMSCDGMNGTDIRRATVCRNDASGLPLKEGAV
jgi:hypothetical protein